MTPLIISFRILQLLVLVTWICHLRRFDHIDRITLSYLFFESDSELPEEYEELTENWTNWTESTSRTPSIAKELFFLFEYFAKLQICRNSRRVCPQVVTLVDKNIVIIIIKNGIWWPRSNTSGGSCSSTFASTSWDTKRTCIREIWVEKVKPRSKTLKG